MTPEDLSAYLARLGLTDLGPPTTDTLARLQDAHLAAIPFEAIDPFLGHTPALDPPALAAKILHSGRGGYCFELNTLYGNLLAAAGFIARRTLARVRTRDPEPGPRSHLAWLAEADGARWLTDVGFGGLAPRQPLRLTGEPQRVANGTFRLTGDPATGERVLERSEDMGWRPIYSFDEAHVTDGDVAAANHCTATWQMVPFASNLLVNGYDGPVRLGLFNRDLTEEDDAGPSRRSLTGASDLGAVFDRIGLRIDAVTTARLWERIP